MNREKVLKTLIILTFIVIIFALAAAIYSGLMIIKMGYNTEVYIDGSNFSVLNNLIVIIGAFLLGIVIFIKISFFVALAWIIYLIVFLISKHKEKKEKKESQNV